MTEAIKMTEAIWITIISAVITPIISGFISYYISRRTIWRDNFLQASVRLSEAFSKELTVLKQGGMKYLLDAVQLLESAFDKHSIAVTEFRFTLPKSKRSSFDKVWKHYNGDDGDGRTCLGQYSIGLGGTGSQGAIQNIEEILEFTEHNSVFDKLKIYITKHLSRQTT